MALSARRQWTTRYGRPPGVAAPSKYRNRKTVVDGIVFDSAKEARRWVELKLLERAGEIRDLKRQQPYALWARAMQILRANSTRISRAGSGRTTKVGRFTPDFEYWTKDGDLVIEDVKSPVTRREAAYRLRKRIFEANYGVEVREV